MESQVIKKEQNGIRNAITIEGGSFRAFPEQIGTLEVVFFCLMTGHPPPPTPPPCILY